MAKSSKQTSPVPMTGGQTDAEKKFEAQALALLRRGAREVQTSPVGVYRALIDAAVRRYHATRKIADVQSEFNALVITLKAKEGSQNLVKAVSQMLAIINQIDRDFPGDPENEIPSAREYMDMVIVPQSEESLKREMMADLAKAHGIVDEDDEDAPDTSKFADADQALAQTS